MYEYIKRACIVSVLLSEATVRTGWPTQSLHFERMLVGKSTTVTDPLQQASLLCSIVLRGFMNWLATECAIFLKSAENIARVR